ncbi:hypothetical protein BOS5A_110575 [Bosea sp. EC-HK365B]|nr:hypothetical protein BOSE21B_110134 [Bosea sp. 21B]CAD5283069.1 hypothetical protein BOSE7B_41080 [Bosea sp. 7B]VVT52140.1 hypothetical protein BOS5A_110575 [Bosea sp. EC-HK365B]VXC89150.1 hypothetical protein BOSE127_70123 [Bosea sp. 127]
MRASASPKRSSSLSSCLSSVISMKTTLSSPSARWFSTATYFSIAPLSSSRFTRVQHGEGESPTFSASALIVSRPSSFSADRMRRSIWSSSSLRRALIAIGRIFRLISRLQKDHPSEGKSQGHFGKKSMCYHPNMPE